AREEIDRRAERAGVPKLLVAAALALMETGVMPGWAAALAIAGVILAIGAAAGLWGWARRVRKPLEATRRSLREDLRWARERMA
ncbi:MAG TPA: phage holin family protein, partial [Anaeromyxobacter sp.]